VVDQLYRTVAVVQPSEGNDWKTVTETRWRMLRSWRSAANSETPSDTRGCTSPGRSRQRCPGHGQRRRERLSLDWWQSWQWVTFLTRGPWPSWPSWPVTH